MRKNLLLIAFMLVCLTLNAQTWSEQNTNMPGASVGVDQVSVVDSNIVWVNGFNGAGTPFRLKLNSRTQDGGNTWLAGSYTGFGATVFPQVLTGVSYSKAFAIAMDTVSGGFASFWKTTDGGASWSLVPNVMNSGATTFADGVLFWNANKGFCYGDPVNNKFDIYYTTDGGTTWTAVPAANIPVPLSGEYGYNGYECTAKFDGGKAAFITNMGRVYVSSNYGVNWAVTAAAPFAAIGTGKIYINGDNKMIAAGMATGATTYTWKQTIDGGATWTAYAPTGTFYQYAMTYVPNTGNMMVSTSPFTTAKGVSYSNDNGASWTDFMDVILQPTAGTNIQCLGVGFADINNGWVGNYATGANTILKYKNYVNTTGISNIADNSSIFEIYPNPSNGMVNFTMSGNNSANLSIFDLTGKTVFNHNFQLNGVAKTSFNFSDYAKGIYFVKYTNGSEISIKKLIIK